MTEGASKTSNDHLLPVELRTQPASLSKIVFNVIAVCTKNHQLTAHEKVRQGVGDSLACKLVGGHRLNRRNMDFVHALNHIVRESAKQVPPWPRCQQKMPLTVFLHETVVGKRGGIEPHAVEANLAFLKLQNSAVDGIPIQRR